MGNESPLHINITNKVSAFHSLDQIFRFEKDILYQKMKIMI